MSKRYQAAILSVTYNGLLVPNAPTIGTATAGAGSASVAFTAPSNVGGGAITSYTAISSPDGIVGTGATSPVTVSGLTNGTAYTFTVVATNAYGSGPASAASNSVTPSLNYVEDVFSTWLYTGNDTSQTITNSIDLAGEGGLVWVKRRDAVSSHVLVDSVNGAPNSLSSNSTDALESTPTRISALTSSGFTVGASAFVNLSSGSYVSWTFREQPKFFDVVTYTGNGVAGRTVAHNLGSAPGCVIVKCTSSGLEGWPVQHRSLNTASGQTIQLNDTGAAYTANTIWNSTAATSTVFTVGSDGSVNGNGATYVAYLFAHNAGGFGLSGTDNVISCGSFSPNGTSQDISLGYEPQWMLIKRTAGARDWFLVDNMRGWTANSASDNSKTLSPNLSDSEADNLIVVPTATGFTIPASSALNNDAHIYIAIRRGPMKTPTTGTEVFAINTRNGSGTAPPMYNSGYPIDMAFQREVTNSGDSILSSRLTSGNFLRTPTTAAQGSSASYDFDYQNGWFNGTETNANAYSWMFRRYPSVFDVVCYTGTGSATTQTHNLGVAPELIIIKQRDAVTDWWVLDYPNNGSLQLNNNYSVNSPIPTNLTTGATSTTFSLGTYTQVNGSGGAFVAYLFATLAGVSKVGSYTGTGALQTINCAFTTGARFVLIKRTDDTGDWWLYDSARGITSGNDPYLFLNTNATQVTGTNYVDTTGVGFQVTAAAPAGLNASGGTYIFLAIA
jgi:hypothetical protein